MTTGALSHAAPSLRDRHVAATRQRLIAAGVALIEEGREPTMRAIAKRAGAGERTVYRYFPAREALERAIGAALKERASAPLPDSIAGLEGYVETLYGNFAAHRRLVAALTCAPWARAMFRQTRSTNLAALRQLVDAAYPRAPEADRRAAALAMRVPLSGAGWLYLADCGLGDDEIVEHGKWTVREAIAGLKRAGRRAQRRAR